MLLLAVVLENLRNEPLCNYFIISSTYSVEYIIGSFASFDLIIATKSPTALPRELTDVILSRITYVIVSPQL
jgi:hypothetical protein